MIIFLGAVVYLMGGVVTVWTADRCGLFDGGGGNDKEMAAIVGVGWPMFLLVGAFIGAVWLVEKFFSAFIR